MLARKVFILAILCCSFSVGAKAHDVTIQLTSIKVVTTSEKSGDEVYFSITKYSNQTDPSISRVPNYPMHWLTKELIKVKDVKLWSGEIKDNESVLLILSLLEQDVPPWNIDDHVGSAKVKLLNKNGKISATWGQPDFVDQPKVVQEGTKNPTYKMYGDGAEYIVEFKMVAK